MPVVAVERRRHEVAALIEIFSWAFNDMLTDGFTLDSSDGNGFTAGFCSFLRVVIRTHLAQRALTITNLTQRTSLQPGSKDLRVSSSSSRSQKGRQPRLGETNSRRMPALFLEEAVPLEEVCQYSGAFGRGCSM